MKKTLMFAAILALAGCDHKIKVYGGPLACQEDYDEDTCETADNIANSTWRADAPTYFDQNSCEVDHKICHSEPSRDYRFIPDLAGYLVTKEGKNEYAVTDVQYGTAPDCDSDHRTDCANYDAGSARGKTTFFYTNSGRYLGGMPSSEQSVGRTMLVDPNQDYISKLLKERKK